MTDKFDEMWEDQLKFMELLKEKRGYPAFPIDITSKPGQRLIKELSHDAMHELFEAIHCLKNSKSHRKNENLPFDRSAFVEELVDCLKYFIEILIYSGISKEELFEIFFAKSQVNRERIEGGY
jgi:hypothetical protein